MNGLFSKLSLVIALSLGLISGWDSTFAGDNSFGASFRQGVIGGVLYGVWIIITVMTFTIINRRYGAFFARIIVHVNAVAIGVSVSHFVSHSIISFPPEDYGSLNALLFALNGFFWLALVNMWRSRIKCD